MHGFESLNIKSLFYYPLCRPVFFFQFNFQTSIFFVVNLFLSKVSQSFQFLLCAIFFKVEQTVFYLIISYSNSILRKLEKCVLSYLLTHDTLSHFNFSDAICCFCINSSFHDANWTLLVIVRLLLSGSFWFLEAKICMLFKKF